jgi:hypothetical protein
MSEMTFVHFVGAVDRRLRDLLTAEVEADLIYTYGIDSATWKRGDGRAAVNVTQQGERHVLAVRSVLDAPEGMTGPTVSPPIVEPMDELGVETVAQFDSWLEAPYGGVSW